LKVFIILIIEVGMKIVCIDDTLPQWYGAYQWDQSTLYIVNYF
jgi:hypothetical protein